ncbi:carbohydrate ABC transporter substrate-binding protein [Kribbella capetownensis]|uniref:Carbohydrate ABC transporter substrate-binding protein n=1 Tax=Kribbella capetownensis TaxID=1572659 RepID=A0A4R0JBK3_9ACTN|nr:ABC transporter substrate-binding protein [Kribbella capetownensis]TCC44021.1 carbohydrate ABC transporter substrate-binding protein [Kribbella capetownensis]
MTGMTRRSLLGASVLAVAGAAVGCSSSTDESGSTSGGGATGTLAWWDHFSSFKRLNDDWAKNQSSALKANVAHTYYDASKAPQAFQLAHQANKMPDIYSNVVGLPLSALVSGKWVHEITLPADVKSKLPKDAFTEGITQLDGKLYGFPMFSLRQSSTLVWVNKDHWGKAGLDPNNVPKDYPGFKDALGKLKGAGLQPLTLAIGADGGRIRDQIDDMAQTAGFPGYQGLQFTTGEYAYHHDAYVTVIEFLKELNDAKLIMPGSNNFGVVDARTRFASGAVGTFIDGIWCAGGSKALAPPIVDKLASGWVLAPTADVQPFCYRGRPSSGYFVSADSKNPDAAGKLLASFMSDEYQNGMIEAMDQPPLNLDLVASSKAIDAYKKGVDFCKANVFLMPQAIVKNPAQAKVDAYRKPVTPHVGNIVQGYLGGSISDLKAELKKLSDATTADRAQALQKAKAAGAKVSEDDYVFTDWKPGQDYEGAK